MGPEKIRNDKVDRKWQNNAYQKGLCGRQVLIETYWNVNYLFKTSTTALICINRNILECKLKQAISERAEMVVLIETYWNVNTLDARPWSRSMRY